MNHYFKATAIALGLWAAAAARAQTVSASSAPLGGNAVSVTIAGDMLIGVPFEQPAAWAGQVAAIGGTQVTLAGSPGWTASQWVYAAGVQSSTYFVQFLTGAKSGHSYTVEANDASSLTLELLNDDLNGVIAGDRLQIVPYWTLGTLFPAAGAGTVFRATTSLGTFPTEIFLTDPHVPALNFSAVNAYYFYNGAWRCTTNSPTVDQSDVIVRCDVPLRFRNTGLPLTWNQAGTVFTGPQAIPLPTATGGAVDNPVALLWPFQTTLNNLALTGTSAFLDSPSLAGRTDLLMVYDNLVSQVNKPAAAYYIHLNGAWRKLGQPLSQDFGTDPISGSRYGIVIRKAATLTGAPSTWQPPSH